MRLRLRGGGGDAEEGQGAAVNHRAVRTVFSARSVIRNEGGARKAAVQETAVQMGIISTSGVL